MTTQIKFEDVLYVGVELGDKEMSLFIYVIMCPSSAIVFQNSDVQTNDFKQIVIQNLKYLRLSFY